MLRVSFASLRSRAILLVLMAILPLLALTLYSYFDGRARAVREVQRDELVAARNLATIQETLIRTTRELLMGLARLPQVQRRDRAACEALFAKVLEQCPYYAALAGADPEGQVFASAPAVSGPVEVTDRLWFQKAIKFRDFVVGEPVLGRISKKYSINLAYPILDEAGRLQGVLTASLDLQWLGSLLAKSDFPLDSAMGLTDSTGKVLFRYPDPLKYVGKMLPDVLIQAMTAGDEGVAAGMGLPGDARLFAFARLSPPWQDMYVAIGLSMAWAVDKVDRDLWRNLIWLGLVAILALAAAWFGADLFIIRPVRILRGVTERLAAGNLTVRSGPDYPVGELGLLAQSFDQMADSLQGREAELKRVVAELQQRVGELRERTAQLEAANRELEAFTYTVSHDLRAPLRSMGGFARVLLEDCADNLDADGQRYLNIIHQEARKMGQLIDDLLALTRLGRKEMNLVLIDMADLVQVVFAELKTSYMERKLQIDIQPLPAALADRVMMRQVLANLLQNAIKFTKGREPALIEVSGRSEELENVYCVKDNGVGFDMKYVHKLFEIFQRLHPEGEYGGTGVGLAIVKRVIDRHGGRVWAESKVGEGATFCFSLPSADVT
ncbi:MAG: ATP-binding protein [Deltaproteobacteria bacterium]|nr:ATP-binding protein [Deltaproteobacteria bacterium]